VTSAPGRRATAKDVAELAGCSISAVSLVVNGRDNGRIAPDLRARILAAVNTLAYRPNDGARQLATRTTSTVALVCPDVRNPFFGDLLYGLSRALEGRFGVDLVVGSGGTDYDGATVSEAQGANLAGLVLANPAADVIAGLVPTCPTVLIDAADSQLDLPRVDLNVEDAARQLADHLLGLGHRRVGYLDLQRPKQTFALRREALGARLREHGADLIETVSADDVTVRSGTAAFAEAWRSWGALGITAVVCADDVLAYGVLLGARSLGVAVPATLSVAAFNDIAYSELVQPALTTMRFDAERLGRVAGEQLLAVLAGQPAVSTIVPSTLMARASTSSATP
jgi:DNA-binding LacI/PurR family transcriptional regulator